MSGGPGPSWCLDHLSSANVAGTPLLEERHRSLSRRDLRLFPTQQLYEVIQKVEPHLCQPKSSFATQTHQPYNRGAPTLPLHPDAVQFRKEDRESGFLGPFFLDVNDSVPSNKSTETEAETVKKLRVS